MKKIRSKAGAFLMAAALTLTMSQPVILNAEEDPTGDVPQEVQESVVGETNDTDVQTPEETVTDTVESKDEGAEEIQSEETDDAMADNSDAQEVQSDEQNNANALEDDIDEAGGEETEQSSTETEGTDSTTADINKPVIEKVEFAQQGQTLKDGDTVSFHIYAYDADTEVESVRVNISYTGSENYSIGDSIWGEYDGSLGCYVASMELQNVGTGRVDVTGIRVVDSNSNYVDYSNPDEFWFQTDGDLADAQIEEFHFPLNGETISYDDLYDGLYGSWVTLNKEIPDDYITLVFDSDDPYAEIEVSYYWNEDTQKYEQNGLTTWSADGQSVKLVLSDIYLERFGGYEHVPMDGMENYSVTVDFDSEVATDARITSVSLDKNGEIVRAGNEVKITVTVDNPDVLQEYGYASFQAAADIDDGYKSFDLVYNEDEQAYTGVFTVDEKTYPCEWYLYDITLFAEDSGTDIELTDVYPNIYSSCPWYFNVYSGNTFAADVRDTYIAFYRQDAYGNWNTDISVEKENVARRVSLSELGISFPENGSEIEGINQTGWEDEAGNPITEDSVLFNNNGYIAIYATYDQNRYPVFYEYISKDGTIMYTTESITLADGATVGDYREKASEFIPDDMTESYEFTGWSDADAWAEDSLVLSRSYSQSFAAEYAGKTVVEIGLSYFDDKGEYAYEEMPLVFDGEVSVNDVQEYVDSIEAPELYPDLRFAGWTVNNYEDKDILDNFDYVDVDATYENCLVRYMVYDNETSRLLDIFCKVVEVGDSVPVQIDLEGYKDVEWMYGTEDETVIVEGGSVTFEAFATEDESGTTPEDPDTPVDPGTPEDPDTPADPGTPENPGTTPEEPEQLPTEEVNTVVENIQNAAAGQTVTVDMGSATVVSKDILEAAKGKDVDIVLDMGGYTWNINGEDIAASNLSDINLEVTMGTTNIPNNLVSALAQGRPVQQISLTHNGDFGFRASLTVNVGSQYAGQYGNLYYYDSDGRMVFMNAGAIGENGNVTLSFSHASDYAIVISDEELSQADADRANVQVHASDASGKSGDTKVQEVSVQTGDNANVLPIVMILIVSAAVVAGCVVIMRRNRIKR